MQASPGAATSTTQHSKIEEILGVRVELGVRQYKVKWKGFTNRHNSWRDVEDLDCDDLILEYNSGQAGTCDALRALTTHASAMLLLQ